MLDVDYRAIHPDVREAYLSRGSRLKFWRNEWQPFSNERHFNRAVQVTLEQLALRADTFDWDHERQQSEETIVVAEIIDVLMERMFPDIDQNSITCRIALHFVVIAVVKRLHDRMKEATDANELSPSEYPSQVKQWSTQARAL